MQDVLPAEEEESEEQAHEEGTVWAPLGGPSDLELEASSEEAKQRAEVARPDLPPQAEIDRHRIDHVPYRAWCPECVEGFGQERPHTRNRGEERSIPMFACDYMYVTDKGVSSRDELTEADRPNALCVMVGKCSRTQCLFAHVVPRKGVDEDGYIVERLKQDILWLGHAKVVVRSDNEPAILRVVEKVVKAVRISGGVDAATHEGSVPYDPQTNGMAEGAVRLIKGQFRTLLLSLQRAIGGRIPVDHPLMTWLLEHAAYVRNVRIIGQDGKTAWQRARGTSGTTSYVAFGEVCMYKARSQEHGIGDDRQR